MLIRCIERDSSPVLRAMLARQAEADERRRIETPGLHLSTIINHYLDTAYPEKRSKVALSLKQRTATYELGDIIEELIADELRQRSGWSKPKPRKKNGVWCSPDGYLERSRTIDEMKSTRVSSIHLKLRPSGMIDGFETHRKFLSYSIQTKCYMHVWDATRGRIHVLFLNGDWRPPFPDPHPPFILRPETPRECRDTWEQMMDHAEEYRLHATVA